MSNEKKNATLGMSHSTANSRLRKMLLFDLLKKHGENICFKCNKPILLIEELSVEHKQPWYGRSAELFWDLNNIAFSHLRCNIPHVFHGSVWKRRIGPEGTAWCSACERFLSTDLFYPEPTRWNGFRRHCKECRSNYRNTLYKEKVLDS